MAYTEKFIQRSDPYKNVGQKDSFVKNIYYGEVVSINDETDGGRIKVKILGLDNKTTDNNELPDCYPLLPKHFHIFPQVGEMVRVFIDDVRYPMRGRFWMGSIISQPQKIEYDSIYTALSTTNLSLISPERAPSTFPDAQGVFPDKKDIALVGRKNTDVILRDKQLELRAGKHEVDNVLKLNIDNPATVTLTFEPEQDSSNYYSNTIVASDKIAIISHNGEPQFKAARLSADDRARIFEEGHPMVRGDVLVEALNIIRRAIIAHIHGYAGISADKNSIIKDLESLNFEGMLQQNVVTN